MNLKKGYIIFPALLLALMAQSCFVAKDYSSPNVVEASYFRTDSLPEDSVTLAEVSWRELFTDPALVSHIEDALENNIDIRIALQQIAIAEAYFKEAKAGQLPTLSAAGRINFQELSDNVQGGGSVTAYEIAGMLSWEADIWGKIRSLKRAGEAAYLQSVSAHQAVKTRLIANVASLYYQLLALDEQLRIAEETIENRESSLETTIALKEAGTVSEVAVQQTEAQLHSARALTVDLRRSVKTLENTFSILLGRPPQEIERTSLSAQNIEADKYQVGYPVQLLHNRPDVMAAEYGLRNAFELVNVARTAFYPNLTVSATGGLQSLALDNLFGASSLFANVVGSLSQPIINGRRIRSQYEIAQSQEEIAYLDFRQSILNASREVSDALYAIEAAEERIGLKAAEYESYSVAVEHSEELLNSGFANYLEVLTARQNALNAQLDLINARYNRLDGVVELYQSLGGGWQ